MLQLLNNQAEFLRLAHQELSIVVDISPAVSYVTLELKTFSPLLPDQGLETEAGPDLCNSLPYVKIMTLHTLKHPTDGMRHHKP